MAVYIAAAIGSGLIRKIGEFDINEKTTDYLARRINIEEATRIISENVGYYLPLVTFKVGCDLIVTSIIGRQLYNLFSHLWRILKPLLQSGWDAFMNGIKKSLSSVQQTTRKLAARLTSFHTICNEVRSQSPLTKVIQGIDYISKIIECVQTGLSRIVQFELTKYYLEIRGLLRALCEKFNIDFLKYVSPPEEQSSTDGKVKDKPVRFTYEIQLEQLLNGTQRQLRVTREIREINRSTRTEMETYTIRIEPGCKEGHIISLAEVGDRDPINIPADLLVTIQTKPHPSYRRQGADLIYTKKISYSASRSKNSIQIPLLDGNMTSVNPGKTIDNDTELVVSGHGLPDPENAGARGRLLIRFDIQAPTNQIHCNAVTIEESVIDQYD